MSFLDTMSDEEKNLFGLIDAWVSWLLKPTGSTSVTRWHLRKIIWARMESVDVSLQGQEYVSAINEISLLLQGDDGDVVEIRNTDPVNVEMLKFFKSIEDRLPAVSKVSIANACRAIESELSP